MDKPTPKPRQFPAEPPQFSATAPAAPRKDQFAPSKPFPATPPQVDLSYDAVQQVPKINAKPWQIAVQNRRATKSKDIGVGDFIANPTQKVSELAAVLSMRRKELEDQMKPEYARIEAAKAALEQLFAERPELAEQAKLSMPNEAQLGVAGLAALLQPNRAFESLATPFRFQQEEQARQQQLNNQQFANDQQEWGLMWQRATGNLSDEVNLENKRMDRALENVRSFDRLVSDLDAEAQQTQRTAMTVQGKREVAGMNNETKLALQLLKDEADMDRLVYKDPSVALPRLEAKLIERGFTPEDARNYAYAAVQSDWFKNEQVQAKTRETLELLPIRVKEGLADIEATLANIDYISARADYTRRLAQATNDDYALDLLKHGLAVQKFNESTRTNDRQATLTAAEKLLDARQAQAKILGDQLEKALQALTLAEDTPNEAEAQAEVARLRKDLTVVNKDIMAAAKAIEGLGFDAPKFSLGGLNGGKDYVTGMFGNTVNVGGAAQSSGTFRSQPQWPVAGGRISSGFGPRRAPTRGASTNHNGLDIAVPGGTPIRPVWAGTVARVGYQANGGGHYIVIRHPNGYETKYLHMQSASPLKVGDQVGNNTVIGKVGSTGGVSTGNHLDVRFYKDGRYHDPLKILPPR
jgi:murein DD-endopeptidase MepM/ murein hydrolase activator NlpD